MRERPTLDEIRAKGHKARHREIGNILARRLYRPLAVYGTWLAMRLGLSANQVTSMALVASVVAAVAIGSGTHSGFVAGVALLHLAFWLDHVDGQVARLRGTSSLDGVYFDYMLHHAASLTLGYALGHGLARHWGDSNWSVAGFAIAFGWLGLNLHNDCRYKAFFQHLKRETRLSRVHGGGGGRPSPPTPWPRSGLGIVTWPLFKLCEHHVVLIALTANACLMAISERLGYLAWTALVVGFAMLAPLLAVARVWRSIQRGGLRSEYIAWFPDFEPTSRAG